MTKLRIGLLLRGFFVNTARLDFIGLPVGLLIGN